MDNRTLGTFLAARRKERGLTQSQFAEQLNITQSAVSKWEQGIAIPDVTKFQEIAAILDIEVSELFMEAGEEETEHAVAACTASDETKAAAGTCAAGDGARAATAACTETHKIMTMSAASDVSQSAAEEKKPRFRRAYKMIAGLALLCIVLAAIILFVRFSEEPVFTIVKEEYDDSGSFEHYKSTYQIVVSYTGHPGREDMLEYAELIKKREHLDYVEAVVIFFCEETEGQYPMEGYREFVCYPME